MGGAPQGRDSIAQGAADRQGAALAVGGALVQTTQHKRQAPTGRNRIAGNRRNDVSEIATVLSPTTRSRSNSKFVWNASAFASSRPKTDDDPQGGCAPLGLPVWLVLGQPRAPPRIWASPRRRAAPWAFEFRPDGASCDVTLVDSHPAYVGNGIAQYTELPRVQDRLTHCHVRMKLSHPPGRPPANHTLCRFPLRAGSQLENRRFRFVRRLRRSAVPLPRPVRVDTGTP